MPCLTGERYLFGGQNWVVAADGSSVTATDTNSSQQTVFKGLKNGVSCIATDQAGTVALAEKGAQSQLWDWRQALKVAEAPMASTASQIRFRPSSPNQISTSGQGQVHLWDIIRTGSNSRLEAAQFDAAGYTVRCHAWRGDYLIAGCQQGQVLAIDTISMRPIESEVAGGAHVASLSLGLGPPTAVTAVAGNDRHVMVGGQAPYIRCFTHAEAGFETLCDISLSTTTVTSLHFGGAGRYLLLINSSDDRPALMNTDPLASSTFQAQPLKLLPRLKVVGVAPMPNGSFLISCQDGHLQLLLPNLTESIGPSIKLQCRSTCLAAAATSLLAAVGSDTGYLRLVECRPQGFTLLQRLRLSPEGLTAIAFSPESSLLAAAGPTRIHVLQIADGVVEPVQVITILSPALHLAWPARPAIDEMRPLVAAFEDGLLVGLDMEPCTEEAPGLGMQRCITVPLQAAVVWQCKMPGGCPQKLQAAWDLGGSIPLAILTSAGQLQTWTVWTDEEGGGVSPSLDAASDPVEGIAGFFFSQDGNNVFLGRRNGTLERRTADLAEDSEVSLPTSHLDTSGGIVQLCVDPSGAFAISIDSLGTASIQQLGPGNGNMLTSDFPGISPATIADEDGPDAAIDPNQGDAGSDEAAAAAEADALVTGELAEALSWIRREMQALLRDNAELPEKDRIPQEQLVLNKREMAALQEAGRRKLQQVESDSAKEHASMQQALACLRGSCWDSLAVKAFSLVGMRAASCKVDNFAITKAALELVASQQPLLEARQNEVAQAGGQVQATASQPEMEALFMESPRALASDPSSGPKSPRPAGSPRKKAVDGAGPEAAGQVQSFKARFNEEMRVLRERKAADVGRIMDAQARLMEIAVEAGQLSAPDLQAAAGAAPFMPASASAEDEQWPVTIMDEEVGCPRPISCQADADQQQGMRQGDGDRKGRAGYEKAVRQMMGGAPGTAAAAAAVHEGLFADRPAWMSDDPAGFSEDQTRQVKAWEEEHKGAMEERSKRCTALEAERKSLAASIEDVTAAFDDSLASLAQVRAARQEVLTPQLEAEMGQRLSRVQGQVAAAQRVLDWEVRKLAELQRPLATKQQELRAAERSFKRDFVLSGLSFGALQTLYREDAASVLARASAAPRASVDGSRGGSRRQTEEAVGMRRQSRASVSAAGSLRPSAGSRRQTGELLGQGQQPWGSVSGTNGIRPPGLSDDLWLHFLQACGQKAALEADAQQQQVAIDAQEAAVAQAQGQVDKLEGLARAEQQRLDSLQEERLNLETNLDIPIPLKMGQVEVELPGLSETAAAFVRSSPGPGGGSKGSLSEAVLMPINQVEDVNGLIRAAGQRKVDTLVAIKDFKGSIHRAQWENARLELQARHLTETLRELQLLRVTREVQAALIAAPLPTKKGKGSPRPGASGSRPGDQQPRECTGAFQQDPCQEVDRKMQTLMNIRQLKDISALQKEQLEELRKEAERLHLKSFPTFNQVPKLLPDQRQMKNEEGQRCSNQLLGALMTAAGPQP
ncbi:hypothetical protein WJX84_002700 [Apatococcus fuscideae]|uniref:Cilia- and flagella-associated protein 43 n=1 Tax=Apatococcus fuscideae TaxID=2026836 RepID=A0AAW1SWH3_9CHLO